MWLHLQSEFHNGRLERKIWNESLRDIHDKGCAQNDGLGYLFNCVFSRLYHYLAVHETARGAQDASSHGRSTMGRTFSQGRSLSGLIGILPCCCHLIDRAMAVWRVYVTLRCQGSSIWHACVFTFCLMWKIGLPCASRSACSNTTRLVPCGVGGLHVG